MGRRRASRWLGRKESARPRSRSGSRSRPRSGLPSRIAARVEGGGSIRGAATATLACCHSSMPTTVAMAAAKRATLTDVACRGAEGMGVGMTIARWLLDAAACGPEVFAGTTRFGSLSTSQLRIAARRSESSKSGKHGQTAGLSKLALQQ